MKAIKNIGLWLLTVFFTLAAIVYLISPGAFITGILCFACAILCCPIIHKVLKGIGKMPRTWVLSVIILFLFIVSVAVLPVSARSYFGNSSINKVQNSNSKEPSNTNKEIIPATLTEDNNIKTSEISDIDNNDNSSLSENMDQSTDVEQTDKAEQEQVQEQIQDQVQEQVSNDSSMIVYFLDVGQGDAIIIESNKHYMLIDAGDNDDGNFLVNYLKDLNVEKLDFVIGTHPHSDHIGGLDDVINDFSIGKIILPNISHNTKTFEDVLDAISNKGLKITKPKVGTEYSLGDASFTIIAPNKDTYRNLNNYSVGIKLTNGKNSFVLYGDAEIEAEYDICDNGINIQADVLKLGHHGSSTSTSEAVLKAVKPSYAIVSAGINNQYGHPHDETLQKLIDNDIKLFRTDLQGNIIAFSDGENISFNTEPTAINLTVTESTPKPTTSPDPTPTPMPSVEVGVEDTKSVW